MNQPRRIPIAGALALGGIAVAAAFGAAQLWQDTGLLSRIPPNTDQPDVAAGETLTLYQSAFTAWAALILLLPVYATVWQRRRSDRTWDVWASFWTVSYLAYLVHLAVSAFGFFGGDFGWMTSTSRVSAFWPGMLLILWWGLDLVLIRAPDIGWVAWQRALLHVAVFILFVGGSAVMGETGMIRILGWVLFGLAIVAGLGRWRQQHA